jgi:cobalt-zinc-cadmium efflux system outer membrane protein
LALFAGCQVPGPTPNIGGWSEGLRRLPPVSEEATSQPLASEAPAQPAALGPAESLPTKPAVQLVQHIEAGTVPPPEILPPETLEIPPPPETPEALPSTAPQPVQLGIPTLADLEQMALTGNPAIARAAALVRAAHGNYIQVGLLPNPVLGYEGQQLGSGGLAEQDGIFVEQEFVRGGKLKLNRQVAAQEWAQREQELAAVQQRVLTDVRSAFYAVLIAQLQEEQYNKLVESAGTIVQYNEQQQKIGERSRGEVIQAMLERERYRTGALNAGRRRLAAWRDLAAVVGQPQMTPSPLSGSPDGLGAEYDWDTVLQRLLTTSPEVAAAMANIERARWAFQRALVEKKPNVTVSGMINVRDEGIGGKPDANLVVGLPLPLWNKNQGGVIQAQGEVHAAERALDQLQLDLQQRLAPVFERYTNARNYAQRYKDLLQGLNDEWLQLTQQLKEVGELAQLDVILFQRTYAQTQLDYLDALREQRQAEAEIEGLLLSGSLSAR